MLALFSLEHLQFSFFLEVAQIASVASPNVVTRLQMDDAEADKKEEGEEEQGEEEEGE